MALGNGHPALADFVVTHPSINAAGTFGGPFIGGLHGWVELGPRGPCFPFVKVVHLRKDGGGRCGDGGSAGDAEIGGPGGDDDGKDNDDESEGDEEFF